MKKDDYKNIIKKIELSKDSKRSIIDKCLLSNKKERFIMTRKKIGLIAIAATFVLGASVFATSGLISSWVSHSSSIPEYTTIPSSEECIKDVGFLPILINEFSNGYKFSDGNVVKNSLKDDNDNTVEKFKSVSFTYSNGDDEVILSQDKTDSKLDSSGIKVATIDDIDFYYTKYTNKTVPVDYEMTDEDKKSEENGDIVFSCGSDNVSVSDVQGMSWSVGNMHYNLMQIDGKLTQDELLSMAKEILLNK